MIIIDKSLKLLVLLTLSFALSGCLGGTIAQQIVRSIATKVADKAVARAMDVDEDQATSNRKPTYTDNALSQNSQAQNNQTQTNQILNNQTQNKQLQAQRKQQPAQNNNSLESTTTDPYQVAMLNSQFQPYNPANEVSEEQETAEIETSIAAIQTSQLVRVELFNLLIGNEKAAVYDKARLIGATTLPNARDWKYWQVATGVIHNDNADSKQTANQKVITFLIPPDIGKLPSGSITMVELARPGELSIARYKAN
jgi:hypothetical protein